MSNPSFDTQWGQKLLLRAEAVLLMKGRVKFIRSGKGPQQGNAWATMILYFGHRLDAFVEEFQERDLGRVFTRAGIEY